MPWTFQAKRVCLGYPSRSELPTCSGLLDASPPDLVVHRRGRWPWASSRSGVVEAGLEGSEGI